MSVVMFPLIDIPIYYHTKDQYYGDHQNKKFAPEKKSVEKSWGKPFEQIPEEIQWQWKARWHLPPWEYNDIVGFLRIGMDGGDYLTGYISLRRKYFPRNSNVRDQYKTILQNQEILPYSELSGYKVNLGLNSSYIEAIKELQVEAQRSLRKRNRNFTLPTPLFSPEYCNFVKAYEELKNRSL